MIRVGLTGGIASGKSTVSRFLHERGAEIIDADLIAREVVAPGTHGLKSIVETFGEEFLAPDGTLNRAKLGELVFSDGEARQALNAVVHPLVRARSAELIDHLPADSIVVEDIPLLAEGKMADRFDLVVVIEATPENQVARMVRDRDMTEDEACARLKSQASNAERRAVADVLIVNDGSAEELAAQLDKLWLRLEQMRTEDVRVEG